MKAKRSTRMALVCKLVKQDEEACLKALGEAQQQLLNEQQQLEQLLQYRQEYSLMQGRIASQVTGAQSLANFTAFMANLAEAIEHQQLRIDHTTVQVGQLRQKWQQLHAKADNLKRLVTQYQNDEQGVIERKLQAEIDDRASRGPLTRR